ncbi:helix-turn-helix domain-containing protein [Saccharothrix lopnurensis]|uniref:Helix-turn-helix domain-containing protein n=1 Tax=Saccharothrix lopnurensis TaxID=1670621 RepID=A0ABW1P0L8_9PSEU
MRSEESPAQSLGKRIRYARLKRLWTQERLACESGVGRVTIARIETGATRPRVGTVHALAKALGVKPSSLVPDPGALWPRRGDR